MKNLGSFKCPTCNQVHSGISEADAVVAVNEFNEHFAALNPEKQAEFAGRPASLEMYTRCTKRGALAESFVPAAPSDSWLGRTLQMVIAPVAIGG